MRRVRWMAGTPGLGAAAGRVFRAGPLAAMQYDGLAKGFSPTELQTLRTLWVSSLGPGSPGRSITAFIAAQPRCQDPAVAMRCKLFHQWFINWGLYPASRERQRAAWPIIRAKCLARGPLRWLAAEALIGAVVCTLLDLGWQPLAADHWQDEEGDSWQLQEGTLWSGGRPCDGTILQALARSCERLVWKAAAPRLGAPELADGVDMHGAKRALKYLRTDPLRHGAAEAVVTGARITSNIGGRGSGAGGAGRSVSAAASLGTSTPTHSSAGGATPVARRTVITSFTGARQTRPPSPALNCPGS
jgi:hypothetical protein